MGMALVIPTHTAWIFTVASIGIIVFFMYVAIFLRKKKKVIKSNGNSDTGDVPVRPIKSVKNSYGLGKNQVHPAFRK